MVDSYSINYGSGSIEIKLKEDVSAYDDSNEVFKEDEKAIKNATSKKEGREIVKGQLADIQRFLDDIGKFDAKDGKLAFTLKNGTELEFTDDYVLTAPLPNGCTVSPKLDKEIVDTLLASF